MDGDSQHPARKGYSLFLANSFRSFLSKGTAMNAPSFCGRWFMPETERTAKRLHGFQIRSTNDHRRKNRSNAKRAMNKQDKNSKKRPGALWLPALFFCLVSAQCKRSASRLLFLYGFTRMKQSGCYRGIQGQGTQAHPIQPDTQHAKPKEKERAKHKAIAVHAATA